METLQLDANGLVFDALTDGPADGRLVVLLHGFPQTSWSWRHVIGVLAAAGYRVVAPDQRGYSPGARPEGVPAYAMPHLVADVVGMLDALGAERADVVGHDWGAAVAWQLADRHPSRVRTVTAVSVPHPLAFVEALRTDDDQRQRSQYMRLFQVEGKAEEVLLRDGDGGLRTFFGGAEATADVDRYVALMQQPGVLTTCLSWYRAQDLEDVKGMGPTTVPTLYVWSDNDLALGPVAAHATAGFVTAPYRFEVLHGVSHWIPEEAHGELSTWLLEHLAAHPA
ncbi:MAG: alpha/beta hydrolase [Frankiaceae bacterium]|nr:alpha/beta hydrolase [Frankiaceae bacterium]